MRGYVEQTWGVWGRDEQWAKHRANFTPDTHRMIVIGDEVAGFVAVEDLPTYVWLVKFYLFQRFRNAGIGSAVLRSVLADARMRAKPVRLACPPGERTGAGHCTSVTASGWWRRRRSDSSWNCIR